MLTHFLNQIVQALVMLRLRNGTVLQKTIEQGLLFQEQLMILLSVGKRGLFFDLNIHNNHRALLYHSHSPITRRKPTSRHACEDGLHTRDARHGLKLNDYPL